MEKVIEKHLTITSENRDVEKLNHEIYSKDKGTAAFKFTVDELTATKVLCLFYFKSTKRYITVEATISENMITIPFDSTSIIADELCIGYLYFEKVEQSTDVYSFAFNVWVSAIDRAKEIPLIERQTGRVVDVESLVTKKELDELFNKIKAQGGTYDDSNLRAELENKADRTEIAQITGKIEVLEQKTDKDTIYDDSALKQRVSVLESKPEIDTSVFATKQELENKAERNEISRISSDIEALKSKTNKDTVYDDSTLRERVTALESKHNIDTSQFATKQELATKVERNEISQISNEIEALKTKEDKDTIYNDEPIKSRITALENKAEIDTSAFATKQELESKADNSEINRISNDIELLKAKADKDTIYDDSALKQRVSALENKTEIDTSSLVTKQELAGKGYLTEHQPLTEYAKKSELPQSYNDTELKTRVERLESKPEINTSALVTKQELENKGYLTQHQSLTEYAKKTELPQPYNDTELKTRVQTLETKAETLATKEEVKAIKLQAGERGEKGQKGDTGERGPKGDKGETGERGPIGPQGLQGIQGIQGLKGERGERGVAGMPGLKGNDGPRGPIGLTGPKGADGAPGQNIINQNGGQPLKYWAGTKSQYNAIPNKDSNTIYDVYE